MNKAQFFALFNKGVDMGSRGAESAADRRLRQLLQTDQQEFTAGQNDTNRQHDLTKQSNDQTFKRDEFNRQRGADEDRLRKLLGANPNTAVKVGDFSVHPQSASSLRPQLTPAQDAAEKAVGKQIADYEAAGGRPALQKDLQSLTEAKEELNAGKRDWWDRKVGGFLSTSPALMGTFASSEKARRDKVRNTALAAVRKTDANPTEKQIEMVLGQVYDPSSSDKDNLDRIDRFLKEQQAKQAQMEQASTNYKSSGYATFGGGTQAAPSAPSSQPPMSFEEFQAMKRKQRGAGQ